MHKSGQCLISRSNYYSLNIQLIFSFKQANFGFGLHGTVDPLFGCLINVLSPPSKYLLGKCAVICQAFLPSPPPDWPMNAGVRQIVRTLSPFVDTQLVVATTRACVIVADTIIIVTTWRKLYHDTFGKTVLTRRNLTMTDIFLRDGGQSDHPQPELLLIT